MKKLLLGLVLMPLLAFMTNPSDQTCMEQIKVAGSLGNLRIEDNYLYKAIYFKGTDSVLGIGLFGMVIQTN